MKTNEEKKAFYNKCSEILGIPHEYHDPVSRRTRWNTRFAGNGKFPGYGLIQCFGSCVRIISREHGTKMFYSYDEVYDFLTKSC